MKFGNSFIKYHSTINIFNEINKKNDLMEFNNKYIFYSIIKKK